ncbi:outer membrane beta-barrel protein [Cyanobium sp. WAJ14-Wanaka]|uniref:outer membrane beta-barrel protein n=1 Tax=Cyanobium sp. WAJ14-Wanaka TaxID=2823725 RepID=UPI0020CDC3B4|nr:outer membrane beta-barrel protein [Cyanobium sp. WAJ14-Wanaka]MCP9774878.1 outer membrane beta-barrel protein [Cyanobium sp. WAJ14-Wanaka]
MIRNYSFLLAASVLAAPFLLGPVHAEAVDPALKPGVYGSLGIGVGFGSSIGINDPSTSAFSNESFKTSTTVGPNVAIGYVFPGAWRVEAEYLGLFASATDSFTYNGQPGSISGNRISTNAVQFNVIKDIPTGSKFVPYIGGGIGFASTHYGVADGSTTGTTFAGQGKVGVSYVLSKNTSIYLGYRIIGIGGGTDLSFYDDSPTTKSRIQQGLDAGFRFRL